MSNQALDDRFVPAPRRLPPSHDTGEPPNAQCSWVLCGSHESLTLQITTHTIAEALWLTRSRNPEAVVGLSRH